MTSRLLWTRAALVAAAVGFAVGAAGCDRFQSATLDECRMATDHVTRLAVKDGAGDVPGWVAGLAGSAAKIVTEATGDRDDAIAHCVAHFTRADVNCVLRATQPSDLERCR